jgi:hypothetical protein
MPTLPVDIVNRARDECGVDTLGDMDEAANRIYWPTLRQLLAAAHWNFARKQIDLVMLADIGGQYSAMRDVPAPWGYMYEWPVDCVHARFVPGNRYRPMVRQLFLYFQTALPYLSVLALTPLALSLWLVLRARII